MFADYSEKIPSNILAVVAAVTVSSIIIPWIKVALNESLNDIMLYYMVKSRFSAVE